MSMKEIHKRLSTNPSDADENESTALVEGTDPNGAAPDVSPNGAVANPGSSE